ncbi:MAG: histone deacetylase family protein [Gammaproteobacteria bacterium]|nr:histone deacetylase family protein [Gammaproteobacteria bacterium]MCY4218473.1 histone deacetylase family protein [Gammaproteobacteria bacterium]MCY4275127.1 histone deacetylase family protein [Gammaproteobacteria bacterium]
MKTIYSEDHKLRNAQTELYGGQLIPPFERPERMDYVLKQINATGLGEIMKPEEFSMEPILRIHDTRFVDFLQTCWDKWKKSGYVGEAIPTIQPVRGMQKRIPEHIEGQLGYFSLSAETSVSAGTWEAALASAKVALTAQKQINEGEYSAFALCRPPGHHAATDMLGGYCFFNNAAICAQAFLDQGAQRVAILDVDFHHGNGTQSIFYERQDVMYLSLHGDPQHAFPHFLGYSDETGQYSGEGFNFNYPMPPNTTYSEWFKALEDSCSKIKNYAPDTLIVSLGVDTYEEDPISFFKLKSDDFQHYGRYLATLGLPTVFLMEGGYAIEKIGLNTVNVLVGFEEGL